MHVIIEHTAVVELGYPTSYYRALAYSGPTVPRHEVPITGRWMRSVPAAMGQLVEVLPRQYLVSLVDAVVDVPAPVATFGVQPSMTAVLLERAQAADGAPAPRDVRAELVTTPLPVLEPPATTPSEPPAPAWRPWRGGGERP